MVFESPPTPHLLRDAGSLFDLCPEGSAGKAAVQQTPCVSDREGGGRESERETGTLVLSASSSLGPSASMYMETHVSDINGVRIQTTLKIHL